MKVKINQKLTGVDGIMPIPNPETGREMTLKDVCFNSLLSPVQEDDRKAKLDKYEIYKLIRDAKTEADLTVEQASKLKECIAQFQPQLIMGQCFEMLES